MMRRFLLALLASACSPEVDSAAPQVVSLTPNVACNAQLTKPIHIMGSNLTPLPEKTLGTEVLELPHVTLTQSQNLSGMPQSGASISIPDDLNNPASSHVRWESESQMT